jgi:calpain-15
VIQGQEDYGVVQKPIPYAVPKESYFFPDEAITKRTKFSTHT